MIFDGKILVARTDRLGDVLMSLPVLSFLRAAFPRARIDLMIRDEYEEVLRPFLHVKAVRPVSPTTMLEEQGYAAALILFDEKGLLKRLKAAGIRLRVGNYSKPRSFVYLNGGKRQRRSTGKYSEGEYGLELARELAAKLGVKDPLPRVLSIRIPEEPKSRERAVQSLRAIEVEAGAPYLVVHPGMNGSALNLSATAYAGLIDALETETGVPAILSEGPSSRDRELVAELVALRPRLKVVRGVQLATLREIFRGARCVMAPSTGPLHLAHYVGATTIGLYSPLKSQQPSRWAPWGGVGKSFVLTPSIDCPSPKECAGSECPHFPCLDRMAGSGLPSEWRDVLTKSSGD